MNPFRTPEHPPDEQWVAWPKPPPPCRPPRPRR